MAAKSPVVLILGAGPNIGQAVARNFASKGYKVALASRSLEEADSTDSQLNIKSDFSKTEDVVNAFTKVQKVFGIPSVVVYNGKPSSQRSSCWPTETLQSVPPHSPPPTTPSPSPLPTSTVTRLSTFTVLLSPRNRLSRALHSFRPPPHAPLSAPAMS